jgi:hypothetical protein
MQMTLLRWCAVSRRISRRHLRGLPRLPEPRQADRLQIVQVLLKNGQPTGEYEDFLTGFVISDRTVWARPVGVDVAKDGACSLAKTATARSGVSPTAAGECRSTGWRAQLPSVHGLIHQIIEPMLLQFFEAVRL